MNDTRCRCEPVVHVTHICHLVNAAEWAAAAQKNVPRSHSTNNYSSSSDSNNKDVSHFGTDLEGVTWGAHGARSERKEVSSHVIFNFTRPYLRRHGGKDVKARHPEWMKGSYLLCPYLRFQWLHREQTGRALLSTFSSSHAAFWN